MQNAPPLSPVGRSASAAVVCCALVASTAAHGPECQSGGHPRPAGCWRARTDLRAGEDVYRYVQVWTCPGPRQARTLELRGVRAVTLPNPRQCLLQERPALSRVGDVLLKSVHHADDKTGHMPDHRSASSPCARLHRDTTSSTTAATITAASTAAPRRARPRPRVRWPGQASVSRSLEAASPPHCQQHDDGDERQHGHGRGDPDAPPRTQWLKSQGRGARRS